MPKARFNVIITLMGIKQIKSEGGGPAINKRIDNLKSIPPEIAGRVPTLRSIAMPADANPFGDIFGGWILAQMDLAGGACAYKYAGHRVATVGIEAMSFHQPVFIGDEVSFYTEIARTGNTSIAVRVDSWALRLRGDGYVKVTEGLFTYVTIDESRQPVPLNTIRGVK